jgi:hypothetical protein
MPIDSHYLAQEITKKFCKVSLLSNHPVIIYQVKEEVDKLIHEIYEYLEMNNLTFHELELQENDYENNDLLVIMGQSETLLNIFIKLFCGSIDDFIETKGLESIVDFFQDHYSSDLQFFILNYFRFVIRMD